MSLCEQIERKRTGRWPDTEPDDIERPRKKATRSSPSAQVVEEFLKNVRATAKLAVVVGNLRALKAIATELFEAIDSLEIVDDPELDGVKYLTINVRAKGSPRDVANLRKEWYRRIPGALIGHDDLIHLAIDIHG